MNRIALLLASLAALSTGTARAELSAQERKMQAAVEANQPAALALLERLVNQNSGTMNLDGVTRVGAMMRAELEALGFAVTWKPMASTGRAGHLIATHKGKPDGKRLLLIGHLDTVFEPSSPFQRFGRNGDIATGPGVGDDKGGMVVMWSALNAMKAAGTLHGANIEIHLTGDEEAVGAPQDVARADLVAAGKRADVALDFEGLVVIDGRDMGSIARRSANSFVLTATGRTGHSSGIFAAGVGDGAIYELARIIASFRSELPEPNLTFNIGLMAGGTTATLDDEAGRASATGKTNIIPPIATAAGDFRTLSPEQTARVRVKMEAIVSRHLPETRAEIVFKEAYPAMAPTDGNRALLDRLNQVNRDLGLAEMPVLDPLKRGAGDISFVAADVDSLAGLGTAGSGDHSDAEQIEIPSIRRQATRAAILMSRIAKKRRAKP